MLNRRFILAAMAATLMLPGCDRLNRSEAFRSTLEQAEALHMRSQRLIGGNEALAREFAEREMSPVFRANGNTAVADSDYRRHAATGFANWALQVGGLVERPLALPLRHRRVVPRAR